MTQIWTKFNARAFPKEFLLSGTSHPPQNTNPMADPKRCNIWCGLYLGINGADKTNAIKIVIIETITILYVLSLELKRIDLISEYVLFRSGTRVKSNKALETCKELVTAVWVSIKKDKIKNSCVAI